MSRSAAQLYYAAQCAACPSLANNNTAAAVAVAAAVHSWSAAASTAAVSRSMHHPSVQAATNLYHKSDSICTNMSNSVRLDQNPHHHQHQQQYHYHSTKQRIREIDSKDVKNEVSPFNPQYRIPLPHPFSDFHYHCESNFIRKRNERERERVRCVNEGYDRLKEHLPLDHKEKRISKVEILKTAIQYIKCLQDTLNESEEDKKPMPTHAQFRNDSSSSSSTTTTTTTTVVIKSTQQNTCGLQLETTEEGRHTNNHVYKKGIKSPPKYLCKRLSTPIDELVGSNIDFKRKVPPFK